VLAREVGMEMISRLDWMSLQPKVIVDLGGGTGEMSGELQKRYQDAEVITLDSSEDMVKAAKQFAPSLSCVCGDALSLPFLDHSVDMIFANLLIPWEENVDSLLRECNRVLTKDGLILFSALGLDTLKEWGTIKLKQCVIPHFIDMHDVGDLMLQVFADPVLDVDYYTMTYRDPSSLLSELQKTGMIDAIPHDHEEVTREVTYEVIFAHAFKKEQSETASASSDGIVRVPLSHLRRQLR